MSHFSYTKNEQKTAEQVTCLTAKLMIYFFKVTKTVVSSILDANSVKCNFCDILVGNSNVR